MRKDDPAGASPDDTGARREREAGSHTAEPYADEIDLIDQVKVIWRARWFIGAVTATAMLAALAFGLTRERQYESRAVLIVQADRFRVGTEPAAATVNYNTATLTNILRSRRIAEQVVDSQDLVRRWNFDHRMGALKRLQSGLSVSANDRDAVIVVSFRDPDPVLARDVVATYVEYFAEITNELNVTAADQVLVFIEARLEEVSAQLAHAEAELRDFKALHGISSFETQTQLLVSAYSTLEDRIRSLTVELTGKRSYLTDRDPEVRELQSRLDELVRQLQVLQEGGRLTRRDQLSQELRIEEGAGLSQPFGLQDVPEIALRLTQLEREATLQRSMYTLLRQQHEAAKIEASRKVNISRLIDPPQVPEEPASRRLVLNLAIAGFLGVFASMMLAFAGEFFRSRAWDEETLRELPFLAYFAHRGEVNSQSAPVRGARKEGTVL